MEYDNSFYDEYDLIEHLNRGCEVEFLYGGKKYSITHTPGGISVIEFYNPDSEKTYPTAEEALEYRFGEKTLRKIIPDMKIFGRSF